MKILGITAPISENSAACLLENGKITAFCEEERFSGIKHAPRTVPRKSIEYCLKAGKISLEDIDYIATGFENVFLAWIKNITANSIEGNFGRLWRENGAYLEYFLQSIRLKDYLQSLDPDILRKDKLKFVSHHRAHAASAARFSGFEESIIISLDGVGEDDAGIVGYCKGGLIRELKKISINQSLGWLYHIATHLCGFKAHSHEGKTMGLSAYGKADLSILRGIAELTETGYVLKKNWYKKLERKYKRRPENAEITDEYKKLAASVQYFLEEAVCRLAKHAKKRTGIKNICLAGGVALNCDMNAKILETGAFENIFVQPAANDAGTALGAAAEIYYRQTGKNCESMTHAYYGPEYSNAEIEMLLRESKIKYKKIQSLAGIAEKLKSGKIVGWFSGRMEIGPRALGNRSILANPSLSGMKDKINREVKHREMWRPFAPSILKEKANEYLENYHSSPFMLLTFKVKKEKKQALQAALHIDGTARIQDVSPETNPRYYKLIQEFEKLTGIPALLNTSFNDKEKPICLSPREALQTFHSTGMDFLALGDYWIEK